LTEVRVRGLEGNDHKVSIALFHGFTTA
jgi:hypothetical protein